MAAVHIFPEQSADGGLHPAYVVAAGRASALFAVLAGVGLALLRRSGRAGSLRRVRVAVAVRAVLLLALGLALGTVDSPPLVILQYYALLFLVAVPLLGLPVRVLAAAAVAWAVVSPLVSHLLRSTVVDPFPIAEPGRQRAAGAAGRLRRLPGADLDHVPPRRAGRRWSGPAPSVGRCRPAAGRDRTGCRRPAAVGRAAVGRRWRRRAGPADPGAGAGGGRPRAVRRDVRRHPDHRPALAAGGVPAHGHHPRPGRHHRQRPRGARPVPAPDHSGRRAAAPAGLRRVDDPDAVHPARAGAAHATGRCCSTTAPSSGCCTWPWPWSWPPSGAPWSGAARWRQPRPGSPPGSRPLRCAGDQGRAHRGHRVGQERGRPPARRARGRRGRRGRAGPGGRRAGDAGAGRGGGRVRARGARGRRLAGPGRPRPGGLRGRRPAWPRWRRSCTRTSAGAAPS